MGEETKESKQPFLSMELPGIRAASSQYGAARSRRRAAHRIHHRRTHAVRSLSAGSELGSSLFSNPPSAPLLLNRLDQILCQAVAFLE